MPLALKNANIYIMDIRNYTWVSTFNLPYQRAPNPTTSTSTRPTNTSDTDVNSQLEIVIGTIGGIIGAAILMAAGIFGYKWYKRNQRES